MRKIAIANQKGGVGKTTTVLNVAAGLARRGKRVLAVDLDPQANLTDSFGVEAAGLERTIFDFMNGTALADVVQRIEEGLDLIPSNLNFVRADLAISQKTSRETLLKRAVKNITDYDFILFDCPPNLGLVNLNAIVASDEILVTVQAEYFAYAGLTLIKETIRDVQENLEAGVKLAGIIVTQFDKRKTLARDVLREIRKEYAGLLFETIIRENTQLAESPSHFKNIFDYRPDSHGAEDYADLAKEIIKRGK